MQSKKKSLQEVVVISASKWVFITAVQIFYFSHFLDKDVSVSENIGWAVTAFVLSLILGYYGRRIFNSLHK